jgi:hypothetical protein
MKTNRKKEGRNQLALQVAFSIVALIAIVLIANTNILINPISGMQTKTNKVSLEWFGLSDALVDDNPEFSSPIIVQKNNPTIELAPGVYYWKAGFSVPREFVIKSEVTVSVQPALLNNEEAYRIENKGNTKILLKVLGMITGNIILEPEAIAYQKNVSDIEKIEVSEK